MSEPRVADGRRSCLNSNGSPKKVHASVEQAQAFIDLVHRRTDKEPYTCPICGGIHIGRKQRRMIFPDAEHPCGTPGCNTTSPHHPNECGRENVQVPMQGDNRAVP